MNVNSSKRKNEDDITSIDAPSKRKRCRYEIIMPESSAATEKRDETLENKKQHQIIKRCQKVLKAVRHQKKFKYHCKKHNATYLVECVREKIRESSRTNRDNLVQSFRSLKVSTAQQEFPEDKLEQFAQTEHTSEKFIKSSQMDLETDKAESQGSPCVSVVNIDGNSRSKPTGHSIEFQNEYKKILITRADSLSDSKYSTLNNSLNYDDSDNSDDSDFFEDYKQKLQKLTVKRKENYYSTIIQRNPNGDGIIFIETDDCIVTDNDEDSDCDCAYHENQNNFYFAYKMYSYEEDTLDALPEIPYTG